MSRKLRRAVLPHTKGVPDAGRMFTQALSLQQRGDLAGAEAAYHQVLARSPRHADSLHYLGTIHYQRGQLDAAAELMAQSIVADGNRAAFYSNLGLVLQAKGMLERAEAAYRGALALQPSYPEASNNLGTVLQAQGKLEEALLEYSRALTLRPGYADAHGNAGTVLKKQGKLEQAVRHFRMALALNPQAAEAQCNLANALFAQEKLDEAIEHYKAAVTYRPGYPDACVNWGNVLIAQSKASPTGLKEAKRTAAMLKYREALSLDPRRADAHYSLGHALQEEDLLEEAIEHYRMALADNPAYPEVYVNWGNALDSRGKVEEAIPFYERGCALFDAQAGPAAKPEQVIAHMNLAMALLVTGRFAEGFAQYEWRYKDKLSAAYNEFPQPLWRGEPLGGSRIFLRSEQGLGDSLQFLRYVPMVRQAGGEVILQIQPCLRRLAEMIPGITVIDAGESLPPFDTHCSLMSLPGAFQTTLETIPSPHLAVPEEERRRAAELPWWQDGMKVGLVWAGNAAHVKDRMRSVPFDQVEPLLAVEGVHFYALQMGAVHDPRLGYLALVAENMADTAAKVACLDLVITADTAMAHLAGSLGVPTWMMLPYAPDWRWLKEREDSPWYPSMRLFRQPTLGDWGAVVEGVRGALGERRGWVEGGLAFPGESWHSGPP